VQPAAQLEAALPTEVDVHEHDVRAQICRLPQRLGAGRRHPGHGDPLLLEEAAGGSEEVRTVIDDQAPQPHDSIVQG